MKNDNTSIKNILCIPHTPTLWLYYINDGERHSANDEQLTKLLTNLAPNLVYNFLEKMSRHLPFFIDIEKKEFQEVVPDLEEDLKRIIREQRSYSMNELYKVMYQDTNINMPKFHKEKETLFSKVMKILHKE